MAKDIRTLFENNENLTNDSIPKGHEKRFLNKLDRALPKETKETKSTFSLWHIAASIVVLLGLGFGAYSYFNTETPITVVDVEAPETKTSKSLGDISPDLKKVEDYYMANINLELSKVKLTPENKELFDGYVNRLEELKTEYKRLSIELTNDGPDELTVNALINNLKFRLNLLYRLKEQLNELNTIQESQG